MVGAELLETGRLLEAIERVAGELKARPGDLAARTFYFELLSLTETWIEPPNNWTFWAPRPTNSAAELHFILAPFRQNANDGHSFTAVRDLA